MLTIGRRLTRERDEMCKELKKLYEATLELHDKMTSEIQMMTNEMTSSGKLDNQEGQKRMR